MTGSLGGLLLLVPLTLAVALFGFATVLSIGGGLLLLVFGLVWPLLWLAGLAPRLRPKGSHPASEPMVTVIAPARDEQAVAEALVKQFLGQSYENWELIVVANNCSDDTAGVARSAAGGDARVKVIEADFDDGVKADALNLALGQARGSIVLELDADNRVGPRLLEEIVCAFDDPTVSAAQTQIRAFNAGDSVLAACQDLEFLIYSEVWNRGRAALGLGSSIGGTGFAARTELLRDIGGWSRDLVEDFALHVRLVQRGVRVAYLSESTVFDEKPTDWSSLVRQRRRWIRGHIEVAARHAGDSSRLGAIDVLYLYSPAFLALSLGLFVMGHLSAVAPRIISGYSYLSPWFWLCSLGLSAVMMIHVSHRAGRLRLAMLVPFYLLVFTFHWVVVLVASALPASWAKTKTSHGRAPDRGVGGWLGLDSVLSAVVSTVVLVVAALWLAPLAAGLSAAPSLLEAPILQASRSTAVAYAGAAGVEQGVVQGVVRDSQGRPIPWAEVTLTGGGGQRRTRANADGAFLVAEVPSGARCEIVVSKTGFTSASTEFDMPLQSGVWIEATLANPGAVLVIPLGY